MTHIFAMFYNHLKSIYLNNIYFDGHRVSTIIVSTLTVPTFILQYLP